MFEWALRYGEIDLTTDDDPSPDSGMPLVTVAEFFNPVFANTLRARLEAEGVFAYVWGEHLGTVHGFLSAAGGGVRVQVRADQAAEARQILAAIERGEYSLDDESS